MMMLDSYRMEATTMCSATAINHKMRETEGQVYPRECTQKCVHASRISPYHHTNTPIITANPCLTRIRNFLYD